MKKTKLMIISHAQVIPVFRNRWKKLAEDKNYEVHIVLPEYWEQTWFGEKVIYKTKYFEEENFFIHPLETTSVKNWGKYFFKRGFGRLLRKIKPDIIYIIHEESIWVHHQIYFYRLFFSFKSKIIFFSMNGMGVPHKRVKNIFKKLLYWLLFQNIKINTKAALVHYPGCLKSLREGGYKKPIFMQTQVGVDEELFSYNIENRNNIRNKLNFNDKIVIGYAGRLTKDKGVDNLFNVFVALYEKYSNLALLLVGNGDLRKELEDSIKNNNLNNIVHITGFVDQSDVPKFMNAMDIFVLGSKTTKNWIDTFPLVTVQAQAIGVPVIASDSASIPWQLGDTALIFKEGNEIQLKKYIELFINNKNLRVHYSYKGKERSHKLFCHKGMNENLKKIIEQVLTAKYIYNKNSDYFQYKAFK